MEAGVKVTAQEFLLDAIRNSTGVIKGYRLGQALFNNLPTWAVSYIAGSTFDPFYKDMSDREAWEWIDSHLIFDDEGVLAVYSGNKVIAMREEIPGNA